MYTEITRCRICGNPQLRSILNLGEQSLTGVFPKNQDEVLTEGPLELVKCFDENGDCCGLVQLKQSYNLTEMYGDHYGYRSGLNSMMVAHLQDVVARNLEFVTPTSGDVIIDIGSNDGTLLKCYPQAGVRLIGIDPIAPKFKKYYPDHITLIPEFFSAAGFRRHCGDVEAKIITSIAMFYDLDEPLKFVTDIYDLLADDGIWVFEQSYMPLMLAHNAYDTICHEHIEYYCVKQIKWMLDRVGLKILDIELNEINGGSFKVIAAKKQASFQECTEVIQHFLEQEQQYEAFAPFERFKSHIQKHRTELTNLLNTLKQDHKTVFGYGASTKGNVILQYCGFTRHDIQYIAEVNEEKFGAFTPKTMIPIISEKEAKAMSPDYFLVLPWAFKENFLIREKDYLNNGGKLIFPLPHIEIIDKNSL
jgi:hypothetical protein